MDVNKAGIPALRGRLTSADILNSQSSLAFGSVPDIQTRQNLESKQESRGIAASEVPDGGYGWVIVAISFLNVLQFAGHIMGFAVLYPYMTSSLDVSYAAAGWIGSIAMAAAFCSGVVHSAIVTQIGCRGGCMLGGVLLAAGSFLAAFAPNIYMLCITYGVISGFGGGLVNLTNIVIVQQYFDRKRGRAAALAASGFSVGIIVFSNLLQYLTSKYSWRGALLIVSAINLNVVALGYLLVSPSSRTIPGRSESVLTSDKLHEEVLLTDDNAKTETSESTVSCTHIDSCALKYGDKTARVGSKLRHFLGDMFDFSLLKNKPFLVYCICTLLMNFGIICFNVHTPNRALHYGIADDMIAIFPSVTGVCTLVSRLLCGILSDASFINRPLQYSVGIALGGLVEITYIFFTDFLGILLWCSVFGVCCGVFLSIQSTALVDLLSVAEFPKAQALLGTFIGISALFVAPFAGFLYDVTNDYTIPFLVCGSLQLSGGLLLALTLLVTRCKEVTLQTERRS